MYKYKLGLDHWLLSHCKDPPEGGKEEGLTSLVLSWVFPRIRGEFEVSVQFSSVQ